MLVDRLGYRGELLNWIPQTKNSPLCLFCCDCRLQQRRLLFVVVQNIVWMSFFLACKHLPSWVPRAGARPEPDTIGLSIRSMPAAPGGGSTVADDRSRGTVSPSLCDLNFTCHLHLYGLLTCICIQSSLLELGHAEWR
jgi:hypothetical protein